MQAQVPMRPGRFTGAHQRWASRLAWKRRLQWALIALAPLLPLALWVHPAWGLLSLLALLYPSRLELPRALQQLDERYGLAYHSALEAPPTHPWRERLEAEARQSLRQARLPKLPWLAGGIYLALLGLVWALPPMPIPGLSTPPQAPTTQTNPQPTAPPSTQPNTPTTPEFPRPTSSEQPAQEGQGQESPDQAAPQQEGARQDAANPSSQPQVQQRQGASPEEASPSQQGQEASGQQGQPSPSERQGQNPQQSGQGQLQAQDSQGEQVGTGQPNQQGQQGGDQPQTVGPNPQDRQPGRSAEGGPRGDQVGRNDSQNPQPGQQNREKRDGSQAQGEQGQPGGPGPNGQALSQPPSTPNRPLSGEAPLRRSDNPGGQVRNLPNPWRGGQPPQSVQRQVERYLESEPLPPEVRDLLRRYFELPGQ